MIRKADHHAPDLPPRHAYLAFYLWLRETFDAHAMIHLGTHGTLEWLPGKAAALSRDCNATVGISCGGSTPRDRGQRIRYYALAGAT